MPAMREEMRSHAALADLAQRQHGVVTVHQLRELGFSLSAIGRAGGAGRIHRVHRGVYAVGHMALSSHGRCHAAVLACGDSALLSHTAAAWLWGLVGSFGQIDVTAPGNRHRREGIAVHRSAILTLAERAVVDGIPTTAVSRSLLDLAAVGSGRSLQAAVERAERLDILRLDEVDSTLSRHPGARGSRRLRQALDIYRDPIFSRARSERLFLDLVREAGLPRPSMNRYVEGHEIDAYWHEERFAVEIDGWGSHRTRRAFERDPVRQEDLKLSGIDSIRVTARRVEREPEEVGRRLRALLERRRSELGRG
jgi:predicted transcriptional regulator of viral defense system